MKYENIFKQIKPSLNVMLFASIFGGGLLAGLSGCNKYEDPPAEFDEYQPGNTEKRRKVLFISIDGVTGEDMAIIQPPAIKEMLKNAKYSWNSYSDQPTTDATTWKSIMTGLNADKHKIVDSTFKIPFDDNNFEQDIKYYPSFIERLQESGDIKYSAAISPWKGLVDNLFPYVDRPIAVENDLQAKDSALVQIQNPLNDLIIVNFNSVNLAGRQNGFSPDVPEYKEALTRVDTFVGEIMDSLRNRPSYSREDWLVIINSNHGGKDKSYIGLDPGERNPFVIYHHDNFVSQEILPAKVVNTVLLAGTGTTASLPAAQATEYVFGNSGDYTIQCKVMVNNTSSGHAFLLGKLNHPYASTNGWEFMMENTQKFRGVLGDGSGNSAIKYFYGPSSKVELRKWYSLAMKIYTDPADGQRYARLYINGEPGSPVSIEGMNINGSKTDLVFGTHKDSWGKLSQIISNVTFWNRALSDEEIANLACADALDEEALKDPSLSGYWPCDEGFGNQFINKSPAAKGKDLEISGPFSWNLMRPLNCNTGGDDRLEEIKFFSQNKDIASHIFYWFGTKTDPKWNLAGTEWLSRFEREFIRK